MKRKKINKSFRLALLFCLLCMVSCVEGDRVKSNSIDLLSSSDGHINILSEVAESIRYIPLQTNDSTVIGRIWKLIFRGNRYYINSGDVIFCFDNEGKYINKLNKKGRGPEEYQLISGFDVSEDNKYMAVKASKELLIYLISSEGFTFLRKIPLHIQPHSINFTDTNYNLLVQYSNEDGTKPFSRIMIDINGDTLGKWPNYLKYSLKDGCVVYSIYETINYRFDNKLYTKELQNDTLFVLKGTNSLIPYYTLNSKDKGLSQEARSNGLYFSNHGNEYLQVQKIFESDTYLYYSIYFQKGNEAYIYNKKSGKKYSIDGKEFLIDDISGGVNFEPKYCNNGLFISWNDAFKFKEHFKTQDQKKIKVKYPEKANELIDLANKLDENDNPVLTIVKMK